MNRFIKNIVLLLLPALPAAAQLKLPALVSDSMVLQRDKPLHIWGWNGNGKPVIITFNGKQYTAKAGTANKWTATLPKLKAGGPYTMDIANGDTSIQLKGILMGDVWLCSGQSNMEFTMYNVTDMFPDEIANSANTNIRQFYVPHVYAFEPATDVKGSWKSASPAATPGFTAVGYFMAKALYEKFKVPIGLIHTSWGGTPIKAWISGDVLSGFDGYADKINFYKDPANVAATLKKDKALADDWYKKQDDEDRGLAEKWFDTSYSTAAWKSLTVPGFWEDQGEKSLDGVVWTRKEIELTSDMLQQDAVLQLGKIDNIDYTYVNGVLVGNTDNGYAERKYRVPAKLLKEGKNSIVVRIVDREGFGGFIKNNKYAFIAGGKTTLLEGSWQYAVGYKSESYPAAKFTPMQNQPAALYNAMIAPLIPYTLKGAAWYQGEADVSRAPEYKKLLPAMIGDWRQRWQDDFPFMIVQLANYMAASAQPEESSWAALRDVQRYVSQNVKNTGLAVAIDVGEAKDIHPHNKKAVGERLAMAAHKVAYSENKGVYSGPVYQGMKTDGNKIILSFTNTGSGLVAKGGELKSFAIAGVDKKFVWANAKIEKDKIIVWSDAVTGPVAVRYAWANNPEGCNLYNGEGLPASPFRTDE